MSTVTSAPATTDDVVSHVDANPASHPTANPVIPVSPTSPAIFTAEQIYQFLPHRYPFALVDRIVEYIPGEKAVGLKNVTYNEQFFQGHFPGRPLMPGVLIIEAMAQVGGVIMTQMFDEPAGLFVFAGIDGCRFRRPVVPGDQLVMTLKLIKVRKNFGKMQGYAEVNGELVAEGELMFSLVK